MTICTANYTRMRGRENPGNGQLCADLLSRRLAASFQRRQLIRVVEIVFSEKRTQVGTAEPKFSDPAGGADSVRIARGKRMLFSRWMC